AGGFLLGKAVEEDGAESLILALQGTGGLPEEVPTRGVVHNRWPECEGILGDGPASQHNAGEGVRRRGNAAGGPEYPENPGPQGRGAVPGGEGRSVAEAPGCSGGPGQITSHRTPHFSGKYGLGGR